MNPLAPAAETGTLTGLLPTPDLAIAWSVIWIVVGLWLWTESDNPAFARLCGGLTVAISAVSLGMTIGTL